MNYYLSNRFYSIVFLIGLFVFSNHYPVHSKVIEDPVTGEVLDLIINPKKTNLYPYLLDYVSTDGKLIYAYFQDGSAWILQACLDEDDVLHIIDLWQYNDEIRLYPRRDENKIKNGDWLLKNISRNSVAYGELDTNIHQTSNFYINQIDTNGYFIQLTDNSDWTIGWFNSWTSQMWHPKDPVLVNKGDDTSYIIINSINNSWIYADITKWQ
ncbi:hypothetical protein N9Y92_02195 [Chlamydiales bacterium]|nr:hypothetical protein [Chlamydiales bacterium]